MSILTDEVKRAKSRSEILGVCSIKSRSNSRFRTGNKVRTAPMKTFKVSKKKLEEYRKMAKKKLDEAKRCNIYYGINYR